MPIKKEQVVAMLGMAAIIITYIPIAIKTKLMINFHKLNWNQTIRVKNWNNNDL